MYRCARSWAGVILTGSTGSGAGAVCGGSAFGGSWRSGGGGPGAGTLFGGLGLFLLPGGRPLRLGGVSGTAAAAGAGAGSGAGSTGAGAGSAGGWGLRWCWLRGLRWFGHRVNIFLHFFFRKILVFVVQKNRKGNAGAAGVYDITVHVGELEAQITQSNGAV